MAFGEFWKDYCLEEWNHRDTSTASDIVIANSPYAYGGGYVCPACKGWVTENEHHICSRPYLYYYPCYPVENKTEKAFRILKVLVEEKIMVEPDSYKKFCELIEKIAAKI